MQKINLKICSLIKGEREEEEKKEGKGGMRKKWYNFVITYFKHFVHTSSYKLFNNIVIGRIEY